MPITVKAGTHPHIFLSGMILRGSDSSHAWRLIDSAKAPTWDWRQLYPPPPPVLMAADGTLDETCTWDHLRATWTLAEDYILDPDSDALIGLKQLDASHRFTVWQDLDDDARRSIWVEVCEKENREALGRAHISAPLPTEATIREVYRWKAPTWWLWSKCAIGSVVISAECPSSRVGYVMGISLALDRPAVFGHWIVRWIGTGGEEQIILKYPMDLRPA